MHVLGSVAHNVAVADNVQHGDVVIGIAKGGDVCQVHACVLGETTHARALVDTDVHEVDPLGSRAGHIELVTKFRLVDGVELLLAVPRGIVDRDLVGINVQALEALQVVDRLVVDADFAVVLVVAGKGVCLVVRAENGHAFA